MKYEHDITKHKTRSDNVDRWEICSKKDQSRLYTVILKVGSVEADSILEMDKIPGIKYNQQNHNKPQPAAQNLRRER